ncbi:MAG: hypothetical protein OHK0023_26780 [Anaerolineae bacterium]
MCLQRILGFVSLIAAAILVGMAGLPDRRLEGTVALTLENGVPVAPEVGAKAPPLKALTLEGQMFDLATHTDEVILNFWASWCSPCVEEMPLLEAAYRSGQRVIGVNVGESTGVARAFADRVQVSYPILLDQDLYWSHMWRVSALPATFFIARDGTIQRIRLGILTEDQLR